MYIIRCHHIPPNIEETTQERDRLGLAENIEKNEPEDKTNKIMTQII